MSRDILDYTHGDTGTKPSDGSQYKGNQRPDSEVFDWFWYHVTESLAGHAQEFDRLDSNDDGVVDAADGASTYSDGGTVREVHPTDIDFLDKLNVVDDGDGTVSIETTALDEAEVLSTVNANADVPNADHADTADYANDANASTYKDNDLDSDGDGSVDNADVADQAMRFEVRTSDPSSPDVGQVWIRSDL